MILNKIKMVLANFLTLELIGKLIAKLNNEKIPFNGVYINTESSYITNKVKAQIYWKFYESAEIRLAKKYIESTFDIIELGSSIGVMATYLSSLKGAQQKIICVEANPNYKNVIEQSLTYNKVKNYYIYSGAIGNGQESYSHFDFGSTNTTGRITAFDSNKALVKINNITISELINFHNISQFSLVCDIEGAEMFLFEYQFEIFKKCSVIIIELHRTKHLGKIYEVDDIASWISNKIKFSVIERDGNVFALKNNHF